MKKVDKKFGGNKKPVLYLQHQIIKTFKIMGKSITCNYQIQITLSNSTREYITGAMKIKEIKNIGESYANTFGAKLVKINIWAQTKTGERFIKKDFAVMDSNGKINHYYIHDNIPQYNF